MAMGAIQQVYPSEKHYYLGAMKNTTFLFFKE
jgi:hypothetical protein